MPGDDRWAVGSRLEAQQRRVRAGDGDGGVQRLADDVVEVDRPGELAEEPRPAALLLGPVDGAGELGCELVHPLLERLDHRGNPRFSTFCRPPLADHEQRPQCHDGGAETRRQGDE
jgi:hypothetical protein